LFPVYYNRDMDRLKEIIAELQEYYLLAFRGLLGIVKKPFYLRDAIEQMDYAGAGSFFIIILVSLFVGMAFRCSLQQNSQGLG